MALDAHSDFIRIKMSNSELKGTDLIESDLCLKTVLCANVFGILSL